MLVLLWTMVTPLRVLSFVLTGSEHDEEGWFSRASPLCRLFGSLYADAPSSMFQDVLNARYQEKHLEPLSFPSSQAPTSFQFFLDVEPLGARQAAHLTGTAITTEFE